MSTRIYGNNNAGGKSGDRREGRSGGGERRSFGDRDSRPPRGGGERREGGFNNRPPREGGERKSFGDRDSRPPREGGFKPGGHRPSRFGSRPAPARRSSVSVVRLLQLPEAKDLPIPSFATTGSSGVDLVAAVTADSPITIKPGKVALIPTGLKLAVPLGLEAQVRSRSGLALNNMVFVLNSPGTIDSDYRGEVGVIIANFGEEDFVVNRGMRVAQLVISRVVHPIYKEVESLEGTLRGEGGFGSTGTHATSEEASAGEEGVEEGSQDEEVAEEESAQTATA